MLLRVVIVFFALLSLSCSPPGGAIAADEQPQSETNTNNLHQLLCEYYEDEGETASQAKEHSDLWASRSDSAAVHGFELMSACKWNQAIKYFDEAISKHSDVSEFYRWKGDSLIALGHYRKALEHYQKAIALNPNDIPLRIDRIDCYIALGRTDDAKKAIKSARKMNCTSPVCRDILAGLSAAAQKHYSRAIQQFDQGLKKNPTCMDASYEKLAYCILMSRYESARATVQDALRMRPHHIGMLVCLADLEIRQRNYDTANDYLDQALKLDSSNALAYWFKGSCKEALYDFPQALALYCKAKNLDVDNDEIDAYIGRVLVKQNKLDEAAAHLIKRLRPTLDTEFVVSKVMDALAILPSDVKRTIFDSANTIVITPTILDYLPELAKTKMIGYPHGQGWSYCGGYYAGKSGVVVAERIGSEDKPLRLNLGADQSALHELGHAYDAARRNLSRVPEFTRAYRLDRARLRKSQRKMDAYYLQPGFSGPHELFAELFELFYCQQAQAKTRNRHLKNDFPACFKYVASVCPLGEIRAEPDDAPSVMQPTADKSIEHLLSPPVTLQPQAGKIYEIQLNDFVRSVFTDHE